MPDSIPAYGTARLRPTDDVVVGTFGSWTIEYTVGPLGVDDGSTILVAFSQTSDMGTPQFTDPGADNYCSVVTDGPADVSAEYNPAGYVRPFKHAVEIGISDGSLGPGDTVTLTLGDRDAGSRGLRAQSFVEADFEFRVLVDAHNSGDFEPAEGDLAYDLVAGDAVRLAAVAPSTVEPGEAARLAVRVEDYWGNVAAGYSTAVEVDLPDGTVTTCPVEGGTGSTTVRIDTPGVHRLPVRDPDRGLEATANPIECREGIDRRTYWGDLHGQSGETVGTGTVREYFAFGRDAAFVDFAAHAGNDFQITDGIWEEITAAVRAFHEPDEFVTFHCYEWSANTSVGGDHNVYFRGDDPELVRSSKWLVDPANRAEGTRPIGALYDHFRGRDDVLIVPHQGGRPAALDALEPDLTPFVEIASVWGVFEAFGRAALDLGHVGFVGGSDDHCGRPGTAPPDNLLKHNVSGGLMAATADELTRASLWDAFKARRVYATTGERILLDVSIGGHPMGTAGTVEGSVSVAVDAHGTGPIEGIDLFRGADRVDRRSLTTGDDRIELRWTGAKGRTRDKLLDWSGSAGIDRGRIVDAEAFGFDHPEQGIRRLTPTDLSWTAYTSGNHEGVRLTLDAPPEARLSVGTPQASTTVTVGELGEHVVDAGHLDARLQLRRTGESLEADASVTLRDDPDPGNYPYYVRVRQADGAMAWSSPVMLTVN